MAQDNQKAVTGYFFILFIGIIALLYRLFNPFFHTLFMALILTGLFYPVYSRLKKLLKGKQIIASLITCLLVFLTVFIPLIYFAVALSNEAYTLYLSLTDSIQQGNLQKYIISHRGLWDDLIEQLNRLNIQVHPEELERNIGDLAKNVVFFIYEQGRSFISNIAKLFLHFIFMLLILFYLFIDGIKFRNYFFSLSPLPDEEEYFLVDQFNGMARVVLVINGFCGILQGILGGIGFWILDLPSPFLWGFLMAILAFLPVIGASAVYIPASIFLVVTNQYLNGILFLVFFVLMSLAVEYLLKPRLVGQQAKMHTLVILLAIIGGLRTFGILGILYGPLIVTAFFSLVELYKKTYENVLLGDG